MTHRCFDKEEDMKLYIDNKAVSDVPLDYLIEKHLPLVHSIVNKYSASGADCDDLLQEGLIGLMLAARAYSEKRGASFSTFAYRCITNRVLTAVSLAEKGSDKLSKYDLSTVDQDTDPQELLLVKERTQRWKDKMDDRLSSFEKNVMYLYLVGYPVREIALRLGCEPKSADNALQRARHKMRAK